jgi:hypothetical protein
MSRANKDKGYRGEVAIVEWLKEMGLSVKRVEVSGQFGHIDDELFGDLKIDMRSFGYDHDLTGEVKSKNDDCGFKTIDRQLNDRDILFRRKTSKYPEKRRLWVVMHGETFKEFVEIALLRGAKEEL